MYQPGKRENTKQKAAHLKVDIMGLAEVIWLDSEKVISADYTLINAGYKKEHKYGV